MEINLLNKRTDIQQDTKLLKKFELLEKLIQELRKREIPSGTAQLLNLEIEAVNASKGSVRELKKRIRKAQFNILNLIEKELKLVPKNMYRNRWLAIGMTIFGVPIGTAWGASMGNMAFIGIGIPIGMVIGMAIGARMDKKAFEEGRQLDLEFKY